LEYSEKEEREIFYPNIEAEAPESCGSQRLRFSKPR
jgi:hypothetical protein